MGLFGALYAGVSGLDSQSNAIGIISNNISNVNTVGYKQGESEFDTLVVPSGTTAFSPGGVIGGNQQLVNQQGTISATASPTDIAISGGGMLFVSSAPTNGTQLFTRAGSFTQDANGNFVNTDNYYLQGLPINPTTGEPEPFSDLTTVNVSSSATGKPTPTSTLTLGANFDASQTALTGPGEVISTLGGIQNGSIPANQIIVGNDVLNENGLKIVRGDSFVITDTGSTTADTFTYGGFGIGRNVTTGYNTPAGETAENMQVGSPPVTGGLGDGNNILDTETNATVNTTSGSADIVINVNQVQDYTATAPNNYASISGVTGTVNGIPAADLNGEWQIVATSGGTGAGTITLQVGAAATSTAASTLPTVSNRTYADFTGNIMNAQSPTDDLLNGITVANAFTSNALNFSISINGNTTKLTYSANPDPSSGTFNSMDTLVQAINDATGSGLTAQVTDGRLYISAINPNDQVTFENGDALGTPTSNPPLAGINWIQELDLPPTLPNPPASPTTHYFNSLQSLANAVNTVDPTNLVATVTNPTGAATLSINEANAQQAITFTDGSGNTGSMLQEFGFQNLQGTGIPYTITIPKSYNASNPSTNMSSGAVTPQFTKDITIYDSLGQSHTIAMNVAKIATGEWAVEFTSVPPGDVISADGSAGSLADGQIAAGIISFNTNGELIQNSAAAALENFTINWNQQTVGASPSVISVNLGQDSSSSNTTSSGIGLTQAAGAFNVSTDQQNGAPTGELTGVNIDQNGFVIATFSNGQTQKMFQLPLANFTNPDGLLGVTGDAYQATLASGPVNPEFAGTSGVGTFTPSALEQSNVDLSTQLTNLIVAQQAYGANSKVLTVADTLLQELDQIIQ